ncbi:GNAT family N-acetyltransferase [Agromyces sp. SYSU T00194]|uniref:GNAT family N-acetyltransferase n=1 Tax=Agromyces chitinivorans TaxID=3158560 RepID=UPI00339A132A
MTEPHLPPPADAASAAALAAHGLRYALVDAADHEAFDRWIEADERGFHAPAPTSDRLAATRERVGYRRTTGVYDGTAAEPETPVATVSSWVAQLTVPGERTLDAWAVSSVTVAPTHRRRGIARALLEGELRTAAGAGVPAAILTASEATIYGRFGFAPAAPAATITVDRRRVGWAGPAPEGTVHFRSPGALRAEVEPIAERALLRIPGEVDRWPGFWDRALGLIDPDAERSRAIRCARYDDADGHPRGFVVYAVRRSEPDHGTVVVDQLIAETDEAYRALWRFVLEHDFVDTVRAPLRSLDEPLRWMVSDPRAITTGELGDHLWLRVLDVAATLETRSYAASARLVLEVDDPLGFAAGTVVLETDASGRAFVHAADERSDLRLGVQELGAIALGATRPSVLAAAGRLEGRADAITAADRVFAADRTPHLGFWF